MFVCRQYNSDKIKRQGSRDAPDTTTMQEIGIELMLEDDKADLQKQGIPIRYKGTYKKVSDVQIPNFVLL
jgi:hypothetical protein